MLFVFVYHAHDYDAKEECANECHHESRSDHGAAMLLVLATLSRSKLNIALFTVNVRLRPEHARDCFDNRLGCTRMAGRSVGVIVGMSEEFEIVVLRDRSVLRIPLAEIRRVVLG
jgi:hypothetical protein